MKQNHHQTRPTLAVVRPVRPVVLTAGPEVVLSRFDKCVQNYHAKAKISAFIQHQAELGRFERPAVSPASLGKMILKHARRQVKKQPGVAMLRSAVMSAGISVLDFYAAPKYRKLLEVGFVHCVNQLNAA